MDKLYVLGGRQRKPGLKETTYENEWCMYEAAVILEVDTNSGVARTCVEYQSPPEARAGDRPGAHFHSGALVGNTLYTCTTTEVLIYRLPDFTQIGYVSLPCFNDLHHVTPTADGKLLVVSTGLDRVVKTTVQGEIIGEWSVVGEQLWARFSPNIDYRKVETTKPHLAHPNFVFELDDEVWATRYFKRDAVSLNGSKKRIEVAGEGPHDGFRYGERILFTAVDGRIVTVNRRNLQTEQVVDLRQLQDLKRVQDGGQPMLPAWCRGLLPIDDRHIWVGFTRMRKTIFSENIRWFKNIVGHGTIKRPTHIALFDIEEKRCLKELDLEPYGLHTVFGIFPALS
jgi:hypothetical protein